MTTRFLDSFDHYTTLSQKWTVNPGTDGAATITVGGARTGANRLAIIHANGAVFHCALVPNLPVKATYIFGFAFKLTTAPNGAVGALAQTLDGSAYQGALGITTARLLTLYRGSVGTGALVATSTKALTVGTWYYVEFRHTVDPAAGVLEVRVDEEVYATFTGNTRATANNQITALGFGGISGAGLFNDPAWSVDDIYVNDTDGGSPNNTYWGISAVEAIVPNGGGNHAEFATLVGAASHWQATNEIPPTEDASYIASPTVNERDTFAFGNLAVLSAQLNAVQFGARVREEAAGQGAFARMYRRAGVDNQGADVPVGTSYGNYLEIMATDPIAGAAWNVDNVNASEFGVRNR